MDIVLQRINMTAFELYLGREMRDDEVAKEREYYCTLCLSKEQQQRRKRMLIKKEESYQLFLIFTTL
jgi:hypothetical protein